jgi:hypothetical protein
MRELLPGMSTIEGYGSLTSVRQGDWINFHLNREPPSSSLTMFTIYRIGSISPSYTFSAIINSQSLPPSAWEGYQWQPTFPFLVPVSWPSGLYRVKYSNGLNDVDVLEFTVKPAQPGQTSKILLQMCVNTPQAYNYAGGKSLYAPGRASKVSFDRVSARLLEYEPSIINWLAAEGIQVEYCTSLDLHEDSSLLSNYDLLLIVGHDEYWSKEMRDNVEAFIRGGGNVAFLSGNTSYRQVRFESPYNRMMVFHKFAAYDPCTDSDRVTVAFSDPPVNRPQNTMHGVGWTYGAFSGPQREYTIRFPSHWAFKGVNKTRFGFQCLNYETDAAAFVEEIEGYPRVTGEDGTPLTYLILASADLTDYDKPGMATMGIFSRNGTVFNAATVYWVQCLVGGMTDPDIQQITRNVIDRLKTRRVWDWEEIGAVKSVSAMTSLNGKLYFATNDDKLYRRFPVGADVPWREMGEAVGVTSLAAGEDMLFAADASANAIMYTMPVERPRVKGWTTVGNGPTNGIKALAIAGKMLYALDSQGKLNAAPISRTQLNWRLVPSMPIDTTINSMTSYSDILYATTTYGALVRTNSDFIFESSAWVKIRNAKQAAALAVIDGMLFMASKKGGLYWIDLRGI